VCSTSFLTKRGSPPDIGDAGGRAVIEALFDLSTRQTKAMRPKAWEKEEIDHVCFFVSVSRSRQLFII
jgi:hypothetical protein